MRIFGWIGGGLSVLYNIPQIYHIYKKKSTKKKAWCFIMERVPKQKVISKNSPKREKNEKKHGTFNIKRCLETLVLRFGWFFKKKGVFRASTSVRLVGNSYCDIFGFFISTGRFQYQYRKVKNHLKKHATVRTKPLCPGFLGKKSTKAFDRAIPSVQGASCTKSSSRKIHFFYT